MIEIKLPVDGCAHSEIVEHERFPDGSIVGRCTACGDTSFPIRDPDCEGPHPADGCACGACQSSRSPTVPASDLQRALAERDEARAQAAVMRRALEFVGANLTAWVESQIGRQGDEVRHRVEDALSSDASRALLEEMEGLRKERDEMRAKVGPDLPVCSRCNTDKLHGITSLAEGVCVHCRNAEHARAESADLRARLERAESEARTLREVHISPAEVRRAVEEEREACAMVAWAWGGAGLEIADEIRARGAGPKKINRRSLAIASARLHTAFVSAAPRRGQIRGRSEERDDEHHLLRGDRQ